MRHFWGLAGWVLLGCSDSSSGDDPSGDLNRDTKLNELKGDDSKALCDEINGMAERDALYRERVCTASAAILGQSQPTKCTQLRDDCTKEPVELCWLKAAGTGGGNDAECANATVGMFLDCMQGTVRATKELYASISCSTPSAEVTKLAFDALEMRAGKPPVECEPFKQACPAFFVPPDAGAP